jgi:hypothetical protein
VTVTDQQSNGALQPLVDLAAKIDLHIGTTKKLADKLVQAANRPLPQPVFGRVATSGLAPASGPLILKFPLAGPDQGHFWYIRSITVGGLAVGTAAAGTADVFISAADLRSITSLAAIGLADWRDHFTSLPVVSQFYGTGSMPLRFNEEIYIAVSGGTSGQMYVASCQFQDYEEGRMALDWGV